MEITNGIPNVKYNDTQGWYDAFNSYRKLGGSVENAANDLTQYGDQFASQFRNLVGRDPNQNEMSLFWSQIVAPQGSFPGGQYPGQNELRDRTVNFINDNFQQQAQDVVNQKLQDQATQANSLGDLFQTQGNAAIDTYSNSLQDFTQKLLERVRPNLITSLQAQGLYNTGGLNQAIAGQQQDAANNAANTIAQLKLDNENKANDIRFSGASAPYQFQQAQALNRLPYIQQQGNMALSNLFNTQTQQNAFNYQMALSHQQAQDKAGLAPGFGQTLGQSFANSFGSQLGQFGAQAAQAGVSKLFSTKAVKKNIQQLTTAEEDDLYDRLMAMPLSRWHYKTEPDSKVRHLGVVTEEALPEVVSEDGQYLNGTDYLGILTLALKVQHRRFSKGAK